MIIGENIMIKSPFDGTLIKVFVEDGDYVKNGESILKFDDSINSLELASKKEKLLNLNTFFSASGIITFKNSIELQETFKILPLEKILIETDSPYLAPVPNRGKKNEPSFIKFTAEKLANIKKVKKEHLIEATSLNFNTLFK